MNMNDYRRAERISQWLEDNGFLLNGYAHSSGDSLQLKLVPERWSGFAEDAHWTFSSIEEAFGFARGLLNALTTFKKCTHKPLKKKR